MVELSTEQANLLAQMCLQGSEGGQLKKGVVAAVAERFNVSKGTVYRLWKKGNNQLEAGIPISLASNKIGCKRESQKKLDIEVFKSIPLNKRRTMRGAGAAVGVGKTTIFRWKKQGLIRSHTNAIKPRLTDAHKVARLKFCLNALRYDSGTQKTVFKSMSNTIHMDEKWFDMSEETQIFYMTEDEIDPYRACQSKTHIPKVMFHCAVIRSLYSSTCDLIFDGKIGIWPFTIQEPAQRSGKNRIAGTMVTKSIGAVTKEVTRDMLINKVIPAIQEKWPAIQEKWPASLSKNLIIQWDNARPHITNEDPLFRGVASTNGFNINLAFQPANSPDTNINDLGFFRSISSLKAEIAPSTLDELIAEVATSFENLCHITLNKVFLSLQGCMIEVMKVKGGNNYNIKHQQKDALLRQGLLPTNLEIELNLVKECINHLKETGHSEGLEALMIDLDM